MIPSSITVNVTLVLMEAPVKIEWMDITATVRLVSKDLPKTKEQTKAAEQFFICPFQ